MHERQRRADSEQCEGDQGERQRTAVTPGFLERPRRTCEAVLARGDEHGDGGPRGEQHYPRGESEPAGVERDGGE